MSEISNSFITKLIIFRKLKGELTVSLDDVSDKADQLKKKEEDLNQLKNRKFIDLLYTMYTILSICLGVFKGQTHYQKYF